MAHQPPSNLTLEDHSFTSTAENSNIKLETIQEVWSQNFTASDWVERLGTWFEYSQKEILSLKAFLPTTSSRSEAQFPYNQLNALIRALKRSPHRTRGELRDEWVGFEEARLFPSQSSRGAAKLEPQPCRSKLNFKIGIDLAVRLMFMVTCSSKNKRGIVRVGQIFKPQWKDQESIQTFLNRVFPKTQIDLGGISAQIHPARMSASYLKNYAKVSIRWTRHLPDHLMMHYPKDGKYISIFSHAGFLDAWNEFSMREWFDTKLDLFPKNFITETLRTYEILFPLEDKDSQDLLDREIRLRNLDPSLLFAHFYPSHHEHPCDALQPVNGALLTQKFPHWGERLYMLWQESENPAPIGRIGRWSESRKSPRFQWWAAMVALSIAIFFGIVASILSAIQVWITYSSWNHDLRQSKSDTVRSG